MEQNSHSVFTIGFTKKNAKEFFEKLRQAGVQRVIDVRLNNKSQLAGFSKREDLTYFLDKYLGFNISTNRCSHPHRRCWMCTRKHRKLGGL